MWIGIEQTIVRCGKCKYESITYAPFMTQSLNHKKSLEQCLRDHFTESEITDKYTCDSCKKTTTKAKKRHLIVKLPKILVFHIKRFDSIFNKIKANTKYTSDIELEQ